MSITGAIVNRRPEPIDPLRQRPELPDRVAYAIGMLLDAADFEAEQLYHRGRLARALRYLHGSGTIAGLRVVWLGPLAPGEDAAFPHGREESLVVEPGLALDRLGRLIEVPSPACIRLDHWYEGQDPDRLTAARHPKHGGDPFDGVVVDLFIRHFLCERGKTPVFADGPFDATDAVRPARLRESYKLELVPRHETDPGEVLPRDPWPNLSGVADPAERWHRIQDAALDSWGEGKDTAGGTWDDEGPAPLREHVAGQDTTSLFLARLTIPADPPASDAARPARRRTQPVAVDNYGRLFVYTAGALARWLGLSVPGHD